jgi:hypothetical protein
MRLKRVCPMRSSRMCTPALLTVSAASLCERSTNRCSVYLLYLMREVLRQYLYCLTSKTLLLYQCICTLCERSNARGR